MCLHMAVPVPLADERCPSSAWDGLDFQRPWLAALGPSVPAVSAALRSAKPVPDALNACADSLAPAVRFVSQAALPEGEAYEAFVYRTGQVPTRNNLHDLFNGLVWQTFPQSKTQLNRLHHEEISANGIGAKRGAVRDAATLFDENGAVLQAPEPLWQALLERDWHRLCVTLRPLWKQARLTLFGHALMEQLVHPRKNITAHVLIEQFAMDDELDLDAQLAVCLQAKHLALKPFTPMPVLGVPGWWPANDDPAFYADAQVFRPRRQLV